jgi:hypothetical protein
MCVPARWKSHLNRWEFRQFVCGMVALLVLAAATRASAIPRDEPTAEELKARIAAANVGDRPRLCVQLAEKQLAETDKMYTADDVEKAQAALTDVVAYSELARDYAIQSHKYQKQTEIAVRLMTRKLTELLHRLGHDDQAAVGNALNRLQRVRDDLLAAMFHKGAR